TQQSIANWQTIQYWKDEGMPRVVLARETSMDEIQEMKNHVDIEIEAFIHGAMCSSYSGRCVLSNHFTNRDSNRGGCCQSCRWKYDLFEDDRADAMDMISEQEASGSSVLEQFRLGVNQKALFDENDNAFAMS
ncbi:U32 family peptidase, partial [Enterobacter quasiroggenkampii]|nr:U32 family peptidase [Enterobacter quasiroggenkampii]